MKRLMMPFALLTALAPTIGQAQDSASVRVSYAGLDLTSTRGQQVLRRRIVAAARRVCGVSDPLDLKYSKAISECRAAAISGSWPAYEAAINAARHGMVQVAGTTSLTVARH